MHGFVHALYNLRTSLNPCEKLITVFHLSSSKTLPLHPKRPRSVKKTVIRHSHEAWHWRLREVSSQADIISESGETLLFTVKNTWHG